MSCVSTELDNKKKIYSNDYSYQMKFRMVSIPLSKGRANLCWKIVWWRGWSDIWLLQGRDSTPTPRSENLISHHGWQIYGGQINRKGIHKSNIESRYFYLCFPPPMFLSSPNWQKEITHSSWQNIFQKSISPYRWHILNDILSFIYLQINIFDILSILWGPNNFIGGLSYDQCISVL